MIFLSIGLKLVIFIIIDNNPKVLPRERFCEFVEKHQSDNSQVILDNCTWNLDAYNFMLGRYFCMDGTK